MKDSRLIDVARKVTDVAAARTGELAEGAAGGVLETVSGLKGQLADSTAELKEIGIAKLKDTLGDFNAALPLLREAGYVVESVSIRLGLAPQITANIAAGAGAPAEKVEAMLAEHAERPLTTLLVKTVDQAARLQSKLVVKGMRPRGLSVDIGLVPGVVVKFGPE